jgi:hypothetical protein
MILARNSFFELIEHFVFPIFATLRDDQFQGNERKKKLTQHFQKIDLDPSRNYCVSIFEAGRLVVRHFFAYRYQVKTTTSNPPGSTVYLLCVKRRRCQSMPPHHGSLAFSSSSS